MIDVVIDRTKWLRGEGDDDSYLLREEDGKMCCLGFACLAAGQDRESILGCEIPSETVSFMQGVNLAETNNPIDLLTWVNDRMDLEDDFREPAIIKLGAKVGLRFSFIN